MSSTAQIRHLGLFEQGLVDFIEHLLMQPLQPSAAELLSSCEQQLGVSIREDFKGAILQLLDSPRLPKY